MVFASCSMIFFCLEVSRIRFRTDIPMVSAMITSDGRTSAGVYRKISVM